MILGNRALRLAADDDIPVFCCCCHIPDGDGARSKLIPGPLLSQSPGSPAYGHTVFSSRTCLCIITCGKRILPIRICQRTNSNGIVSFRLSIVTYCRAATTCCCGSRTMYRICFRHARHQASGNGKSTQKSTERQALLFRSRSIFSTAAGNFRNHHIAALHPAPNNFINLIHKFPPS